MYQLNYYISCMKRTLYRVFIQSTAKPATSKVCRAPKGTLTSPSELVEDPPFINGICFDIPIAIGLNITSFYSKPL